MAGFIFSGIQCCEKPILPNVTVAEDKAQVRSGHKNCAGTPPHFKYCVAVVVNMTIFANLRSLGKLLPLIKDALDETDQIAPKEFVDHFSEFNALIQAIVPLCRPSVLATVDLDEYTHNYLNELIAIAKKYKNLPNETTLASVITHMTTNVSLPKLSKELAGRLLLPIVLKTYYLTDEKLDDVKDTVLEAVNDGTSTVIKNNNENTRKILDSFSMIEDIITAGRHAVHQQISQTNYLVRIAEIVAVLRKKPKSTYSMNFEDQFEADFKSLQHSQSIGDAFALKYGSYGVSAPMSANQAIEKVCTNVTSVVPKSTNMEDLLEVRRQQDKETSITAKQKHKFGACKYVSPRTDKRCTCLSYQEPVGESLGPCATCEHSTSHH